MPPIEVPCPPIYFVVEYTTMAAPCSSGRHSTGAAVLSTISGTPELAADLGHFGDREHFELRVGQCLGVIAARPVVGRAAEVLGIGRIDKANLHAHRLHHRVEEEVPGAAVKVGRADEIVARLADVLHREQRCGLTRGERQRGDTAFERGNALLEHRSGRVHDAGVDIARARPARTGSRHAGCRGTGSWWSGRSAPLRRWSPDRSGTPHGARVFPDAGSWSACKSPWKGAGPALCHHQGARNSRVRFAVDTGGRKSRLFGMCCRTGYDL